MKKLLTAFLAVISAACISAGTLGVFAATAGINYNAEKGLTEISLSDANADKSSVKKLFDYWGNNEITFTEQGAYSVSNKTSNAFNLVGIFPLSGKGLSLEIGFPVRNPETGDFADEDFKADNYSIVFFKGVTGKTEEVAKMTVWGNKYKTTNNYVVASVYVGAYTDANNKTQYKAQVDNIKLPKSVVETGGSAKIGFSLGNGFMAEQINDSGETEYKEVTVTESFKQEVKNLGIEEITRIQVLRAEYCTNWRHLPKAIIKSVNEQSFVPTDGKLVLSDVWASSAVKLTETNYEIGKDYRFTLNTTQTNNNLLSDVQKSDAYMQLFSVVVGDVGWNENGNKGANKAGGIYITVRNGEETTYTAAYTSTWGHVGSKDIIFKFDKSGINTLIVKVATNDGYTVTKSIEIDVNPVIELNGDAEKTENGLVLPTAFLKGDTNGGVITDNVSVKLYLGDNEIVKEGTAYKVTEAGKYVARYTAENDGETYTFDYEIYYDGENIMTKKIVPNFMFTDNAVLQKGKKIKIYGTGGNAGTTVTVSYDGQEKTCVTDGTSWETYLDPMDYNDGETLVISYGGQTIEYKNVAVGEVYLCSGQSNMQISVNYIFGKDKTVQTQYTELGNDFSGVSVFAVPAGKSDKKQSELTQSSSWVNLTDFTSCGRFSAYAMAFAQNLSKMTGVKVGIITSAVGGSAIEQWLEEDSFKRVNSYIKHYGARKNSELFNAMISPVTGYDIGGILWYQGETNAWPVAAANDYLNQEKEYVESYRRFFNDENLPVVFTQLVQYAGSDYSRLREQQWQAMFEMENVYTVSAIETGDASGGEDSIHPADKWKVGGKAAGLFAEKVLGIPYKDLLVKSYYGVAPYFESATEKDGTITVQVANANTLTFGDGEIYLEAFVNNSWVKKTLTADGTKLTFTTDGEKVTKVRYLQGKIVPKDAALLYNEYHNAVAPCYELEVKGYIETVEYNYAVTVEGKGSVTPVSGTVKGGEEIELTLTADEGYEIESVTVNGKEVTALNGKVKITVDTDLQITVKFKKTASGGDNPPEENKGCGGNVTALSALVPALALIAAAIMLKRRKSSDK